MVQGMMLLTHFAAIHGGYGGSHAGGGGHELDHDAKDGSGSHDHESEEC